MGFSQILCGRRVQWRRRGALFLTASAPLLGCAPSHRIVHHRGAYFERCHAADFTPARTTGERRACWSTWRQHYSAGDDPERLAYADRRLIELQEGKSPAPLTGSTAAGPEMTRAAFRERAAESVERPALTGASPDQRDRVARGEPPVNCVSPVGAIDPPRDEAFVNATDDGTDEAEHHPTVRDSPIRSNSRISGQDGPCAPVCEPLKDACVASCASYGVSCRQACLVEHRICLRGCP